MSDLSVVECVDDITIKAITEPVAEPVAEPVVEESIKLIINEIVENNTSDVVIELPAPVQLPVLTEKITITPSSINLQINNLTKLNINFFPQNATNKNVIWESSNENIIKVEKNSGLIKAVGPGIAYIRAMTTDGSNLYAISSINVLSNVTRSPIRMKLF